MVSMRLLLQGIRGRSRGKVQSFPSMTSASKAEGSKHQQVRAASLHKNSIVQESEGNLRGLPSEGGDHCCHDLGLDRLEGKLQCIVWGEPFARPPIAPLVQGGEYSCTSALYASHILAVGTA